jgi:hypothetical protein
MSTSTLLGRKVGALELLLRRSFWQPLRWTMEIFHPLPLTAATIVSLLLATSGQIREIYVSYLEDLNLTESTLAAYATTAAAWIAAAIGISLISAVLYVAHYRLSTMRINVVSLTHSNVDAGTVLRKVQRLAGLGLALLPWLAVVFGLFGARNYISYRYYQLRDVARVEPATLESMQHVAEPGAWSIAIAVVAVGVAIAAFLDANRREPIIKTVVVAFVPVAAAMLLVLLTNFRPSHRTWIAVVVIALAYCGVAYWLETTRSRLICAPWLYRDTGINVRGRRRVLMVVLMLAPWVVMSLYFAIGPAFLPQAHLPTSPQGATPAIVPSWNWPSTSRWALFAVVMAWVGAVGIILALALERFRETPLMQITVVLSVITLLVVAIAVSHWNLDAIVSFYRIVGPIGSTALTLVFMISMLAALAALSQRSGFPALALVVLSTVITVIFPIPITVAVAVLAVICGFVVVMALLSRLWAVAIVAAVLTLPGLLTLHETQTLVRAERNAKVAEDAREQFECWLDGRESAATDPTTDLCPSRTAGASSAPDHIPAARKPYPVFIIAVEGGGIYAGSAASLFLARLQDQIPGFAEHVFAISGVSGGAIGATIFQALAQSQLTQPSRPSLQVGDAPKGCRHRETSAAQRSLTAQVCAIMQDDHLSPIIGAIIPEFLGTSMGRAETLAASFASSTRSQNMAAGKALHDSFTVHWQDHSRAPALVLNSTWVETGFRAAFAPFALHQIDDSLYSFYDQGMPDEKDRSLMFAAVASARFPGMLPPFSVAMDDSKGLRRWNFVDGAYSDNSGAATALALYDALDPIATRHNAEIRVILLTSSNPEPDLTKISGTVFRDTLAPIDAVLKVREGLGTAAVARACNRFYPPEAGGDESADNRNAMCRNRAFDKGARLWIVEIENQTYGLPLGWKLSRTTFEIVSWMLGDFDSCSSAALDGKTAEDPDAASDHDSAVDLRPRRSTGTRQLNEQTLIRNSCVLGAISALLAER